MAWVVDKEIQIATRSTGGLKAVAEPLGVPPEGFGRENCPFTRLERRKPLIRGCCVDSMLQCKSQLVEAGTAQQDRVISAVVGPGLGWRPVHGPIP